MTATRGKFVYAISQTAQGFDVPGPVNSRFQPYRLEQSKCWGDGDARLICVACHDPYQQLQHDAAAYDQKCLACHPTAAKPKSAGPAQPTAAAKATPWPAVSRNLKPRPVATTKCATCHMPKVNVAVMHSDFTDHRIGIVRKKRTLSELKFVPRRATKN